MKRFLLRFLLAAVAVAIVGLGGAWLRYPGFVADAGFQLRRSELEDVVGLYRYMLYYTRIYGRIERDPATGLHDLSAAYASAAEGDDVFDQAMMAFHTGRFAEAAAKLEDSIRADGESDDRLLWLGLAYQRLAEQRGCRGVGPEGPPACSLPLRRFHADPVASQRAMAAFERLLARRPGDRLARWLLNFSAMTIDRFPAGVPETERLGGAFVDALYGEPPPEVAAALSRLSFRDRAAAFGLDLDDAGKGVAVEDFDLDLDLDVVTGGTFSGLRFFRNEVAQGKAFVDATTEAGLSRVTQPFIVTAADYDGDGWIDLFVSRPFDHFLLLRNVGGVFHDVTVESGLLPMGPLDGVAYTVTTSAWADVDADGFLDLFVAGFGQRVPFGRGLLARRPFGSRLFLNVAGPQGRRRFVDATARLGLERYVRDRVYFGAAFGDVDDDGWVDLFLSSPALGRSLLLHNEDGREFRSSDAFHSHRAGFTAAFVDWNHDGRLDLFQGGHGPARRVTASAVFGEGSAVFGSAIHLQDAAGRLVERRDLFVGEMPIGTMGSSFGDLDSDGAYELYLGTGNPESAFVLPNLLYLGELDGRRPTGRLHNASGWGGFGTVQKGHGIVFFDADGDGDEDVYSSLGGMWPGDSWPNQLFVNESPAQGRSVTLRLAGDSANRYGVGARIRVEAEAADGERIVRYATIGNKTGFGSAPYLAHVGLADAVRIRSVEVRWPRLETREGAGGQRISRPTVRYEGVELDELNLLLRRGDVLRPRLP